MESTVDEMIFLCAPDEGDMFSRNDTTNSKTFILALNKATPKITHF